MFGKIIKVDRNQRFGLVKDLNENVYYIKGDQVISNDLKPGYVVDFQVFYSKRKDRVFAVKINVVDATGFHYSHRHTEKK